MGLFSGSKKNSEERKEKIEKMELLCYKVKVDLFKKMIEEKNLSTRVIMEVIDGLTVNFRLETNVEALLQQISMFGGIDFYECSLTFWGSVRRTQVDAISKGPHFFLSLKEGTPYILEPYRNFIIPIFTMGQTFYAMESRSYSSKLERQHSITRVEEYLWPANFEMVLVEYNGYFAARSLGMVEEAVFKMVKNRTKNFKKQF